MSDSTTYYNDVVANLTWYRLNSDYKDPMYQYMLKLERELYAQYKLPSIFTNFKVVDDFVVNANNKTLYYGSYECSAPGKQAFMDSWFSCFLFQIPFFLEKIQLGYIGFVFVLPIMLISIFGGIKESYKWFILNQAIWDAFLCYDFVCTKPTMLGWSNDYLQQNTCFYRTQGIIHTYIFVILQGFRTFLRNASFIPVFHLALSRFICMYFPTFYKKFTKNGYKIFIFILIFNLICITLFSVPFLTPWITVSSVTEDALKCQALCPLSLNGTYCTQNIPKYFQCQNRILVEYNNNYQTWQLLTKILKNISHSISPLMFFLSIICTGFLFYKIASQLKFQLKNNYDSFKSTIKISSVVAFQCLTMSIIFVITGIQKFMQIKSNNGDTTKVYDELPTWLLLLQYYTTTASLNMIRIILDSVIILTILTGYSRCAVLTLKFLLLCFVHPKKAFKKIKYRVTGSIKVKIISQT